MAGRTVHVFFDASYELTPDEMLHMGSAAARASIMMTATAAATQVFFFGGKRGSGKTYAAGRLTEQLLIAGVQVVVIDVVGNWWGLRVGETDDDFAGFEIPVIGGAHGDIPVLAEGGAAVARMLVETGSSAVLDLSGLRKGARQRFITDWAEEFFHLKKTNLSPVHVVLEEAHTVVPQRIQKGQERMFGALEDLVRLGRNYGIGISMLDQRPQSVNKEVLHQAEVLCAFQFTGAHERDAIRRWAEAKELPAVKEAFRELASLPRGRCVLWSPLWLHFCGQVDVGPKITFDASATPEFDPDPTERLAARDMVEVNLGELHEAMLRAAKKEEKPKPAKDPDAPSNYQPPKVTPVAPHAVLEADIARLTVEAESLRSQLTALGKERQHELVIIWPLIKSACERMVEDAEKIAMIASERIRDLQTKPLVMPTVIPVKQPAPGKEPRFEMTIGPQIQTREDSDEETVVHGHGAGVEMGACERKILVTLAQHGKLTKKRLLGLAGYAASGKVSAAFASHLRNQWVTAEDNELEITPAGRKAIGAWAELPTGKKLLSYLLRKPGNTECDRRILETIWSFGSEGATKAKIVEQAKYATSGKVSGAFAKWVRLGYVKKTGNKLVASETLYDH